jgi:hypothetical protein
LVVEQAGELARRHPLPDLVCVTGVVEQVRVDVEGDCRARVAEDAADLGDVKAEVDDQMACEGVA